MKDLHNIYGISSIIFLIVLAISPAKDYFTEWRAYQNEYNELIKEQPVKISPAQIGIKQIWVQKLGRVDRCVSCHLGLKEKAMAYAKQPFRTHPNIYHDIEEFGCTICHRGQGLATNAEEAMRETKYWDEPLLPRKYIEASCGVCHKESEAPDAPKLTLGRKLLIKANCVGCHKIGGLVKEKFIPSLNGIGDKVNRAWLVRWLKNPGQIRPETLMPDFRLSDEEANILADFLMTFKKYDNNKVLEPLPLLLADKSRQGELAALGEIRLREARCISCHRINGKGGSLAPDIGKIASKVSPRWLYTYLKNPKSLQPGVEMPRYGFDEKNLAALTAYIMNEFVDEEAVEDTVTTSHQPVPNFMEKGEKLFRKYNCSGCHELAGVKKSDEMGPDLSFIGSKKLYELEFGKSGVRHTLPDYIYAKLKMPRAFLENARMPDFHFTEEEIEAITVALLSYRDGNLPIEYIVPEQAQSTYNPQGGFGKLVDDLSCFACHKFYGRGGTIAPDLTIVGSQLQTDWIKDYFKVPYTIRPILTERMLNLFITDKEINAMVEYMEMVLRDNAMDSIRIPLGDKSLIAEGQRLYYDKYGCQACHQIGAKGGYVGPPLDKSGSRLKSAWLYSWLKNPQKYKPDTIEPNNALTDEEAKAITVYLMSLKQGKTQQ